VNVSTEDKDKIATLEQKLENALKENARYVSFYVNYNILELFDLFR